ncbi:uncharacterized protein LOC124166681 [Ischnura elegans]|uniref:uncharacterized protein LOC124166681 n=1 Tax=Ischnura elegans TaxID=197161 RepID=UPI001ED885C1|nr:uncharacterized protein LOC124166681 [Ischnura elegans]
MGLKLCGTASKAVIILAATMAILLEAVDGASLNNRRNVESEETTGEAKTCDSWVPCGWAMFTTSTRRIDYFIENNCRCAAGMQCRNMEINSYLRAYVYRCTQVIQ